MYMPHILADVVLVLQAARLTSKGLEQMHLEEFRASHTAILWRPCSAASR